MTRPPSIPADLWDAIPPDLRPAIAAVVAGLEARIADLEARLNQTSANSSRPPSADPPYAKPAPPRPPTGKPRGGQPGHPKAERVLLPTDADAALRPARCRRCSHRLAGDDPTPLVHQVREVPEVRPHVTKYRRHRLTCPGCGATTCAPLPAEASSGYGPRAEAACALLAGGHHVQAAALTETRTPGVTPGRFSSPSAAPRHGCFGCTSTRVATGAIGPHGEVGKLSVSPAAATPVRVPSGAVTAA